MENLFLDMAAVHNQIFDYKRQIGKAQTNLVRGFLSVADFLRSSNYRGKYANAIRVYLREGAEKSIRLLYQDLDRVKDKLRAAFEVYHRLEPNLRGKIEEETLSMMIQRLQRLENAYDERVQPLQAARSRARKFISPDRVSKTLVNHSFSETREELKQIKEDLREADQTVKGLMGELASDLAKDRTLFHKVMDCVYSGKGPSAASLESLSKQGWYQNAVKDTASKEFNKRLSEERVKKLFEIPKPFTKEVHVWDPVFGGKFDAVSSFRKLDGVQGFKDGIWSAHGEAALGQQSANYHSDFLDFNAKTRELYAKGHAKAGWNDTLRGFEIGGEAGFFNADASATLHFADLAKIDAKAHAELLTVGGNAAFHWNDAADYNGLKAQGRVSVGKVTGSATGSIAGIEVARATGEASIATADGHAICAFDDNGYGELSLGYTLSGPSAQGHASIGTGKYPVVDPNTGEVTNKYLWEIGGSVGAGAGTSAGFSFKREKVRSLTKYLDICTNEVDIQGSALLEGGLHVKLPGLHVNWKKLGRDIKEGFRKIGKKLKDFFTGKWLA